MSSLGISFLAVIGMGFLISIFSYIAVKLLKAFGQSLIENALSGILTVIFFLTGYDMCLSRGQSFAQGLGSDSWVPVALSVMVILIVVFFVNRLFVRMGRIYAKKWRSKRSYKPTNSHDRATL